MAKLCEPPAFTIVLPLGVMLPFAPALALIEYWSIANVALMVWLASTFVNV